MPGGRKSLKEELRLFERYSELTEPYFRVIREHFESDKKEDRRWAVERIEKAFVKMIPQETDLTSGGLPLILPGEIINKNALDTPSSTKPDSEGHPPIQGS